MSIRHIRNIWQYKDFIFASVKREFQSKYQNSILGAAWVVINPLAMVLVYTVIFSQVMQAKLPGGNPSFAYSIYLCSGIFTWGLFAEIVGRGQNIFIDNANIIKKLNFPRVTLPIIMLISAVLNFMIIFGLFVVFLVFSGQFPGWTFLAIIPVLLVQIMFSMGLGMSIGVLNVFFRDVGQLFTILMQFWFWLTTIIYPITVLPEVLRPIVLNINPLAPVIMSYHTILVDAELPDWSTLITPLICSIVLCIIAIRLFSRHTHDIVDEL